MTPWKWDDKRNLWVNSVDDETMTAIEYDNARCKRIAQLEAKLMDIECAECAKTMLECECDA